MTKRYSGLHIALEHRYYGKGTSQPVANLTVKDFTPDNLQWLTVDQVLADTAEFIKGYNSTLLTSKWITIGGSYAGNLAAWMRLKYPNLVYAAHSSSAPLNAIEDFWQYGYGVDIGLSKSGGSQVCAAGWRRAVGLFDDFIASNNASVVLNAVGAPPNLDVRDLAGVSTNFATLVQYGISDYVDLGNFNYTKSVTYVCSGDFVPAFIDPSSSDAELLADYIQFIKIKYPTPQSFSKLDTLANETNPSLKLWTWQICRDFGYFQVHSTQSTTAYSRYLTVDYFHWLCTVTFNIPNFRPNVTRVNSQYLGLGIYTATTRIVFVNGDTDPYSFLSVTPNDVQLSTNPGQPGPGFELPNIVLNNSGGRHCQDLSLPSSSSSPAFIETHSRILQSWDLYINFNPNLPNGGTIPNYSAAATISSTAGTATIDAQTMTSAAFSTTIVPLLTATPNSSVFTSSNPPAASSALWNTGTTSTLVTTDSVIPQITLSTLNPSPTVSSLTSTVGSPYIQSTVGVFTLIPTSTTQIPSTAQAPSTSVVQTSSTGTAQTSIPTPSQTASTPTQMSFVASSQTPSYPTNQSLSTPTTQIGSAGSSSTITVCPSPLASSGTSSSSATPTDQIIVFPNFTVPGQTATLGGFSFIFNPAAATTTPVNNDQC
ncbi:hypothetical protein HK103_001593 [Boothiomyces macroporosus]|uniref:Peptidase S28 n=1 Tax=Boothiomyces macroporosus TaxID=261099 RepID=A0AAD5UEC7_9FUNG|nr:hypothetical protein HK103_001593 [Boothiomyces macroporosus]